MVSPPDRQPNISGWVNVTSLIQENPTAESMLIIWQNFDRQIDAVCGQ